jgi:hypothetical protein
MMSWSDREREVLTPVDPATVDRWAGEDVDWVAEEVRAGDDAGADAAVRAFRGLLFGALAGLLAWAAITVAVLVVYRLLT